MLEDRQPIKLLGTKLYSTYQICCCIYPINELITVHEVFNKLVLYILSWYRTKAGENSNELFSSYPSPADYRSFDISLLPDIQIRDPFHVNTFYLEELKNWTFRLNTPDSGIEFETTPNEKIEGRSFIDNIAIKEEDKYVAFSYKCACKEPQENQNDCRVIRPLFIKQFCRDNNFFVKELPDVGREYDRLRSTAIVVESNSYANHLAEDLILNEKRQLPVLLLSGKYAESNVANSIAERLLAFCHVFSVHEKQFNRLFKARLANKEVKEGDIVLYKHWKDSVKLEIEESIPKEDIIETIKIEVRKYPLRKNIDYRDTLFYRKKKKKKYSNINTNDPVELKETIEQLREQINAINKTIKEKDADIEKIQEKKTAAEKELKTVNRQNKEIKEKNDSLTKENDILSHKVKELDGFKKLVNYIAGFPKSAENIPQWVQENFFDQLLFHDRAVKALNSSKAIIDVTLLCSAILYLNAYMLNKRNEITEEELELYMYDKPWQITPCGKTSIDKFPDEYTIDLSKYDTIVEKAVLNQHLKSGNQRENLLRIYFTFVTIAGIEKLIIGSLPDHLRTSEYPH